MIKDKRIRSLLFLRRVLLWCIPVMIVGALWIYWSLLSDLPSIRTLDTRLVLPTTQILDRNDKLLYEIIDPNNGKQLNLSLRNIPQACQQSTLATEDSRFYKHIGVDPVAIARALLQNWRGREVVSGGSTLTQQLARNLFLAPEERYTQSARRKIREAWLALQLEFRYTKEEVLAMYLNQTYYGNFAYGMEAAAQVFFAKAASELSQAECALLAGLVQYPTGYNPLLDPEIAKARQLTVLRLMREAGYLTNEASQVIAAEPLRYRSKLFEINAPHFVMMVQDQLAQQHGSDWLHEANHTITTTLDLDLQRRAEEAVRYRLDQLNCRSPGVCDAKTAPNRRIDNAAAVILDAKTGEILAMVGSPDYFDAKIQGNVNAALSLRQPGSAIKPLTYAAALDGEWSQRIGKPPLTPASIIADLPTTFYVKDENGVISPYQPANYDRRVHGPVSVRTALANSYNIPAVKTLDRIGVQTLKEIAGQAGIRTFTKDYGLALTLGGGEVRLLELTAAYGMFLTGRRLDSKALLEKNSPPHPITQSPNHPIITPETAYLITDILSDNYARIPAFGENSVLHLPFAAAAKTGTTTDYRDNWTIGYSTERIVGVWVGNADGTPMLDVSGIDGAGPIWRDLMLAAHSRPPAPFVRPAAILDVSICAPSGLLPTPECPTIRTEHFVGGTQPTQPDTQFQRVNGRVYWQLPAEYQDWMRSQGIAVGGGQESGDFGELSRAVRSQKSEVRSQQPASNNPQLTVNSQQSTVSTLQSLLLIAPTSNTTYRISARTPRESQRLEVSGYVADGTIWAVLRLIKDGEVVAEAQGVSRLEGWWVLQPGSHHFWMEGTREAGGEVVRSGESVVTVEESPK